MSIAVSDEISDAKRLAEVIALHEVNAAFLQELHLLGGFHAFGHRQHFQLFRQRNHRIQHRRGDRVLADGVDEAAINLQVIHGETLKIDQRAVAGAKIVHRDLDALFMQPVELRQRALFFHHAAFGDFKHQRKVIARQLRQQFIHVLME